MENPFSKQRIEKLSISRFIFHIISDYNAEPVLLDEVPCEEYEDFFLDLVFDSLKGTRYSFKNESQTQQLMRQMYEDGDRFVEISRQLAVNFSAASGGNASPGIFFVLELSHQEGEHTYFALIKYDNQTVLQYRTAEDNRASIGEIANAITRDRRALQKSALIFMDENGAEVLARDRQSSGGELANYFKGFLHVVRANQTEHVTRSLHRAVVDTVNKHAVDLPPEFARDASSRFADAVGQNPDDIDAFYGSCFADAGNDAVRDTFQQMATKHGLYETPFELDRDSATRVSKRRYRTLGGITFQIPQHSEDWFSIEDCADGTTEIVIKTRRLWEN